MATIPITLLWRMEDALRRLENTWSELTCSVLASSDRAEDIQKHSHKWIPGPRDQEDGSPFSYLCPASLLPLSPPSPPLFKLKSLPLSFPLLCLSIAPVSTTLTPQSYTLSPILGCQKLLHQFIEPSNYLLSCLYSVQKFSLELQENCFKVSVPVSSMVATRL
jgi:hypothetical protein